MTTILIGECKQEVSTFNPIASTLDDFDISIGDEIFAYHRTSNVEISGALDVFGEKGDVQVIPAYSVRAITSAGALRPDSFAQLAEQFVATFQAAYENAPAPVDGIYLSMHGAMGVGDGRAERCGEGREDDPEGYLLAALRKVVGEQMPIVVSLDLHGILTDRILQHSDAIVAYHTYPHVDFYETGQRAARLLLRIINGEVKPVTARVQIPALVRGPELITETGKFGQLIRHAQTLEADMRGLSAGMFIGNPFTDVLDLATNSFVVVDGVDDHHITWAKEQALAQAQAFWAMRTSLHQPLISLDEAVDSAQRHMTEQVGGTVVFVDAADATSSGASGDSNAIMCRLLEWGYTGHVLLPIVDAPAVQAAMAAGVGNQVEVTLGGQLDRARFTPCPVTATVRTVGDGQIVSESHGSLWNAGLTAVLLIKQGPTTLTVIVTSRPISLYDRSIFYAHGLDPQRFDAVVVKSPHCQEHMFAAWASAMLNVDAPGSTSANLPYLGHTRARRPLFPLDAVLDEDGEFEPAVQVSTRRE
ncbi:MAG: M81 family metallopeptidase [Chloroflexota bacterium]